MIDRFFRDLPPWHGGLARVAAAAHAAHQRSHGFSEWVPQSPPAASLSEAGIGAERDPLPGLGKLRLGEAATELVHGLCEWCLRIELNRALQSAPMRHRTGT